MHETNQCMHGYVREHYKHYIIECEIKPSKLTLASPPKLG